MSHIGSRLEVECLTYSTYGSAVIVSARSVRDRVSDPDSSALQSHKAVSAYLLGKQILPFGFAWQTCTWHTLFLEQVTSKHLWLSVQIQYPALISFSINAISVRRLHAGYNRLWREKWFPLRCFTRCYCIYCLAMPKGSIASSWCHRSNQNKCLGRALQY